MTFLGGIKKIFYRFIGRLFKSNHKFRTMYKEYLFNGVTGNVNSCGCTVSNSKPAVVNDFLKRATFDIVLNHKCTFRLIIEQMKNTDQSTFELTYSTDGLDACDPNDYVNDLQKFNTALSLIRVNIRNDFQKMMY